MAKNKDKAPVNPNEKPAWQQAQQKETVAKDSAEHLNPPDAGKMLKIKMKTAYRDVAKAGDVWKTDAAKAAELVRLGRAEYVR